MSALATPKPLAESLREHSSSGQGRRRAARAAFGVAAGIFLTGVVLGWIAGDQQALFFVLILAVVCSLSSYALLRMRASRALERRLRREYEPLLATLTAGERSVARTVCANILTLCPHLGPGEAGVALHAGESFDFAIHTLLQLIRLGPELGVAESLEGQTTQLEALLIHLSEGLVESEQAQRALRVELNERLGQAFGQARLLEAALETERILVQDLKETEAFLREVIGRPESVVTQRTNAFLDSKRERRSQILGHFGDFLLVPAQKIEPG